MIMMMMIIIIIMCSLLEDIHVRLNMYFLHSVTGGKLPKFFSE